MAKLSKSIEFVSRQGVIGGNVRHSHHQQHRCRHTFHLWHDRLMRNWVKECVLGERSVGEETNDVEKGRSAASPVSCLADLRRSIPRTLSILITENNSTSQCKAIVQIFHIHFCYVSVSPLFSASPIKQSSLEPVMVITHPTVNAMLMPFEIKTRLQ